MSCNRRIELDNVDKFIEYRSKLKDISIYDFYQSSVVLSEDTSLYNDLPF